MDLIGIFSKHYVLNITLHEHAKLCLYKNGRETRLWFVVFVLNCRPFSFKHTHTQTTKPYKYTQENKRKWLKHGDKRCTCDFV